jgi:cardiolipin synthase
MRVPRPRNVVAAIVILALLIAAGLLIAQDQDTLRVQSPLGAGDAQFPVYLSRLLGHPLTDGDSYIVYTNGPDSFAAMLKAIDTARHRISFETYIFDVGRVAELFTAAFERAAGRGVEVRLVLDSVGAKTMEAGLISRLERAGCKIGWFNEISRYYMLEEVNYRTHRKALVIDGDVAFVGGIGIADHWASATDGYAMWRDTQVEVRGPAAVHVEAAFNENWIETGGVVAPDLLPHDAAPMGQARSIVVWSSPQGGENEMKLLYLLAIAAARRTLDIQSPYLITDETTNWSLEQARRRGVRVRLLVEGEVTDAKPVKFAGRAGYEWLMERGAEVFEYQPAMMHTKAMVVDGILSIVGSANFDNRSLELNDELNIAVFDAPLAARLTRDFEQDLKRSTRLDLDAWRARPIHIRAREQVWSYFGEVF